MPAFLPMLGGMLLGLVGGFVGRTLASLGLAIVTYVGIDAAFGYLKSIIANNLGQLPAVVVQILGFMKVGQAISILFACMFASMLLNGLNSSTFKKWIIT